ncbi:uncharacterized protein EI90DRAFT_3117276 [Cantharellus anzutake]|uniref:uncharacterized protein n=1 Tax=Cantharellus anzutake TaxID=1750568 RepID=UPI00190667CB|nr:uncharacterized protein EI90DRAFT_3117276 [Cantharellus anzutake]KAF8340730.1 hypothetical protein EI90DRAFT_3117276 [Cantharellus anzutake]
MVDTNTRRSGRVAPSVIRSETFLFALVVVALGVIVPYYTGRHGPAIATYQNATSVPSTVISPASEPSHMIGSPQHPEPGQQQYSTHLPHAVPVAAVVQPPTPAPITYIVPFVISAVKGGFRFLQRISIYALNIVHAAVFRPLRLPLAMVWSVLRPVTLLLEIVYILFIRTTFSIISWFVTEAIYPLYVFFGVAALLGGGVGYMASYLPAALNFGITQIRASGFSFTPPKPAHAVERVTAKPTMRGSDRGDDVKAEEEYAETWRRTQGYVSGF